MLSESWTPYRCCVEVEKLQDPQGITSSSSLVWNACHSHTSFMWGSSVHLWKSLPNFTKQSIWEWANGKWARSMGVATIANKKTLSVMLMGHAKQFECTFFADINWLLMLTSCSGAYKCRNLTIFMATTDKTDYSHAHREGHMYKWYYSWVPPYLRCTNH